MNFFDGAIIVLDFEADSNLTFFLMMLLSKELPYQLAQP